MAVRQENFPTLERTPTSFQSVGASMLGAYRRSHFRSIIQLLGEHPQFSKAVAPACCVRVVDRILNGVPSLSRRYEIERIQSPLGTKAHCSGPNWLGRLESFLVDYVLLCLHSPYLVRSAMTSKIRAIGIFLGTTGRVLLLDDASCRHPSLTSSTLALSYLENRFSCRRSRSLSCHSKYTPASAFLARLAGVLGSALGSRASRYWRTFYCRRRTSTSLLKGKKTGGYALQARHVLGSCLSCSVLAAGFFVIVYFSTRSWPFSSLVCSERYYLRGIRIWSALIMAVACASVCGLDSVDRAKLSQMIGAVDAFRGYMKGEPHL